jgi:UDP-N-acetylmuramoylalanine--D-glutamate ligase
MGLGLNQGGVGAARYFAQQGKKVLVTDLKSKTELQASVDALAEFNNITYVLGEHQQEDFINTQLVIASPAVPPTNKYIQLAKEKNIPCFCPMSYFFTHKQSLSIGVTGTRGKSTTTNLIYQMLKQSDRKNLYLGGNIGKSVMDFLDELNQDSISVLEISNLMLEWLKLVKISPEIAVITNIYPDHLNYHQTYDNYIAAKKVIFKFQNQDDLLVLNPDNSVTSQFASQAPSKVIKYNLASFDWSKLKLDKFHPLSGHYNQHNIMAAVCVVRSLGVSDQVIIKTIHNYTGLYGRQMDLSKVNGVRIINDSCSTMPQAVIVALKKFQDENIVLVTGGMDKKLDYQPLAQALKQYSPKAMLVLAGTASDKLKQAVKDQKLDFSAFWDFQDLKSAFTKAMSLVKAGDLLLFSPGAASFNMFSNEFDRGEQFDQLVKGLK